MLAWRPVHATGSSRSIRCPECWAACSVGDGHSQTRLAVSPGMAAVACCLCRSLMWALCQPFQNRPCSKPSESNTCSAPTKALCTLYFQDNVGHARGVDSSTPPAFRTPAEGPASGSTHAVQSTQYPPSSRDILRCADVASSALPWPDAIGDLRRKIGILLPD